MLFIAGYIFGASALVGHTSAIRMSPQTLVCIALLTFVQSSRRAPHGFYAVVVGIGIGSQFARVMLPISLVLCYLIVWVGAALIESGALGLSYAAALIASGTSAILIFLAVFVANRINGLEAELREKSLSDELTGCHNRRGFYLLGEQTLRDTRRAGKPISVLFFDADGLKKVNDTFGHDVGSELLLHIGTLLRATFRSSDVVGRVGGDEFAVIAQGSQSELEPVLRRLDNAIEAANYAGDRLYHISVSVGGVTSAPQSDQSLAELVDRADAAMYQKKRQRRAREADSTAQQVSAAR